MSVSFVLILLLLQFCLIRQTLCFFLNVKMHFPPLKAKLAEKLSRILKLPLTVVSTAN